MGVVPLVIKLRCDISAIMRSVGVNCPPKLEGWKLYTSTLEQNVTMVMVSAHSGTMTQSIYTDYGYCAPCLKNGTAAGLGYSL